MTTFSVRTGARRLPPGAIKRGVIAGLSWGLAVGVALPALGFIACGTICLSDVAITTGLSVAAGLATFGPFAAVCAHTD
jgi:hypothetical protein